jgi:hypothetical protein
VEINATNNAAERVMGWTVKDRCWTMWSYKSERSILNVTAPEKNLPYANHQIWNSHIYTKRQRLKVYHKGWLIKEFPYPLLKK